MPNDQPASSSSTPAPVPTPTTMLVRWSAFALGTGAVAATLAGAAAMTAGGDVRVGAVAGAAAALGPLIVSGLVSRGHPMAMGRALRSAAGLQMVGVVAALVFAPAFSARAVRDHGSWPARLAGLDEHTIAGLDGVSDTVAGLIDGGAASPVPPVATTSGGGAPVGAATPTPTPTTPREVFAARADSVVVVQVRQAAPPEFAGMLGLKEVEGHGSGFVVDGGLIVTNHHVAGDATSIRVRLKNGKTFDTVRVIVSDPQNDLCVLAVDGDPGVAPVPLAAAAPVVGDNVNVIGSPLGLDHTLTTGLVSALRNQSSTKMVQIDAVVAPGSSGGPVFSSTGEIIGVATAMQGQGLNMAVSVEHVRAALLTPRSPSTEKALQTWIPGFEFKAIDTEGGALLPTTRANLLGVLPPLVQTLEGCVAGRPAGVLTARLSAGGVEVVAANPAVKKCVDEGAGLYAMFAGMVLREGQVAKVTTRYEASDGRVTVIELIGSAPSKDAPAK